MMNMTPGMLEKLLTLEVVYVPFILIMNLEVSLIAEISGSIPMMVLNQQDHMIFIFNAYLRVNYIKKEFFKIQIIFLVTHHFI